MWRGVGASLHLHHLSHALYMIWIFYLLSNTQNCIKILNQYFPNMDAKSFVQTPQFLRLHVAFAGKSCAWLVLVPSQRFHKFSWQRKQKHFKHFSKAEIWAALFAWNCMLLNNSMDMWRKCSVSWFIIYSVVESRCYAMTSLSLPCFVNKKSAKILSKTRAWKQYFSAAASCICFQRLQNTFREPDTSVSHPLQSPAMPCKSFVEGSYFKK